MKEMQKDTYLLNETETEKSDLQKQQLKKKWLKLLKFIKSNVSQQAFRTWFLPIKPLKFDGKEITVEVPSQFYSEWIDQNYYPLISSGLQLVFGSQISLRYKIRIDSDHSNNGEISYLSTNRLSFEALHKSAISKLDYSPNLVSNYTFDNFVVGKSNDFAHSVCLSIARNPKQSRFNPLIIYGNTGLGKTHLLQAIGNFIIVNNPQIRVYYSTSEDFANGFIEAIRNNSVNEFIAFFRKIDVLLIDDIQFFQNKGKIQEHFFHTFNSLHQSGKQIVMTCDKPIKETKFLDERLLSRFQLGVSIDIKPPDYETRIAITKKKCETEGLQLPSEVIEYIARKVANNIREIEGTLVSISANLAFTNRQPTIDLVDEIIQSKISNRNNFITIDSIKQAVASYFNLKIEDLESKSKKREIAMPRQLAMYLAKEFTNLTLASIGMYFGGRDHSTVLHSINVIERNLLIDPKTKNAYDYIVRNLL